MACCINSLEFGNSTAMHSEGDLTLWLAGSFRNGSIHPSFQHALGLVERWVIFWRIQFSVQKCERICYNEKNVQIGQEFDGCLYDTRLLSTTELRCLGVWFDESLMWWRQIYESIPLDRAHLCLLSAPMRAGLGIGHPFCSYGYSKGSSSL